MIDIPVDLTSQWTCNKIIIDFVLLCIYERRRTHIMNSDIAPVQERNYLFDNIKALMLFLVPLGHTLDVYISDGNIELYISLD